MQTDVNGMGKMEQQRALQTKDGKNQSTKHETVV